MDGASKCNPGTLGTGGLIMDPLGRTTMSFSWGLGQGTNNYDEFCALSKGIKLKSQRIERVLIFNDSKLIIVKLNRS